MFVLGTAGHIDHGKSFLVRALTGIDPDRLPEEKERGMTIDLGFAWLALPSGREVGIVDVPGHERFIKNMLAGVGGIDLALLIVAANEGVMPQTREHLAILDLLEVQRGIVAITKKDLVDEELLSLVKIEIEELIRPTALAQAPIVAVSALTGEGLAELVSAIDRLLASTEPKKDIGRPRLPIDRVFTISGAGTVVTGTLINGSLHAGQEVEIVPAALKSRLRGLQTHKSRLNTATPGSRVAANIVGIAISQLSRGDVLTTPGWLIPTMMISANLKLLPYLRHPLRHNASVSFHTGTAEALAKMRLLDKEEILPGETGWVQISLSKPVAMVNSDRFIIRSPTETLGGGKIVDSHARRLRRFRPAILQSLKVREAGTSEDAIIALLEAKQPLELSALLAQGDLLAGEAQPIIESLVQQEKLVQISQGGNYLLFTAGGWERLAREVAGILQDYHHRFPIRLGMLKVELSSRLKLGAYAPAIWQQLVDKGVIIEDGNVIRLATHQTRLTPAQQAKIDTFLASLAQNPYSPPGELIPEPDLVNLLIEQGKVVKVGDNIIFATTAYNDMVSRVTAHIKAHGKVTLAEVRDLFQTSRKYAQALLEHLDEKKITRRVGDARILYK